jgi:hypothetical protein
VSSFPFNVLQRRNKDVIKEMQFVSLGQAQHSEGRVNLSNGVACEDYNSVPNDPTLFQQEEMYADHFVHSLYF